MQKPDNLAAKDVDLAAGKSSLHPGGSEAQWNGEVFKVVAVGNVSEERRWSPAYKKGILSRSKFSSKSSPASPFLCTQRINQRIIHTLVRSSNGYVYPLPTSSNGRSSGPTRYRSSYRSPPASPRSPRSPYSSQLPSRDTHRRTPRAKQAAWRMAYSGNPSQRGRCGPDGS